MCVAAGIGSQEEINKSLQAKIRRGIELDMKVLEPEIQFKTAVEILCNEKSKVTNSAFCRINRILFETNYLLQGFHHLIKTAEPAPPSSADLAERLNEMAVTLPPYRNLIPPDACFDQDEDDFEV